MASVNKVIILGNATAECQTRAFPGGGAVGNVTIATNRSWKDKNSGEKREEAEFHRVVFMGKLADIAGQYITKGKQVYVEGRLKTRKWTDKEGIEKYSTEIIAEELQLLGGREGAEEEQRPRTAKSSTFDDMNDPPF